MENMYRINGMNYSVTVMYDEHSARIGGGSFGNIAIDKSAFFNATLKNTVTGETRAIDINTIWKEVRVNEYAESIKLYFTDPDGLDWISFCIEGIFDNTGICWSTGVMNDNSEWAVTAVTYTTPKMTANRFNLFVPDGSGIVIEDAGNKGYVGRRRYPGGYYAMQYFAVYDNDGGIYIGIEDEKGAIKEFSVEAANGGVEFKPLFYGLNTMSSCNSFSLSGHCRWEYMAGDWYDATMLYADFVRAHADWVPKIESNGRPDSPGTMKDIPFWVCDYIPNSPSQGDNKPMSISAGSDLYEKDYWVDAVIMLQRELGVPIAYHVYNWHKIPFNIEYPHFLPAKEEFIEGAKKLSEHPIYIFPYINAGSWEIHDDEMGYADSFEAVGKHGAVIRSIGDYVIEKYPQITLAGSPSRLANMCPSSKDWHVIIYNLVREMEETLPIDGIYFDQTGCIPASPCHNPAHGHLPGGGAHWAEGYRSMMEKINSKKPVDAFYFTENNAENYMKTFDGFLTWMWVKNGQVPAFPAVYAGYIELIGRNNLGKKKDDYDFFKFSFAEAFMYGQQLGWYKADVVYDQRRMEFLKKVVRLRYRYNDLFHCSDLLRPPRVTASIPAKITPPAMSHKDDIVMSQISAGAWRYRNKEKLVIFCYNIAETDEKFELSFSAKEYGLCDYDFPEDFVLNGDICTVSGTISAEDFLVWELNRKS